MIIENNLRHEKTYICFLELQVVPGKVALPRTKIAKAKSFR